MKRASPTPPFRVLASTPYHLQYFREVLLGARRYGFDTGRLMFINRWSDREPGRRLKSLVERNGIQGVITAIHHRDLERKWLSLGLPVINISNSLTSSATPMVTQDDHMVGKLAARHLLLCGCQTFGFWGQNAGASYSDERLEGFQRELNEAGFGKKLTVKRDDLTDGVEAVKVYQNMTRWLALQPRPIGIFAVLDSYAVALLRAAREIGLRVPEDVAVLGAGNDDFYVQFEDVPLSSVELPARRIGYEAAVLLDKMISQRKLIAPGKRLPVSEIAVRKSSDILYVSDPAVARAAHFIREHSAEPIYLADIVRASGVCRTVLQRRFRSELGRSIQKEVLRVRVGMAQSLLARTELPMTLIAERSGFANSQRLSMLFRRFTGFSPSAYRKRLGGGSVL